MVVRLLIFAIALGLILYVVLFWSPLRGDFDRYLDSVLDRQGRLSNRTQIELASLPSVNVLEGGLDEFDCRQFPKFLAPLDALYGDVDLRRFTGRCFDLCGGSGHVQLVTKEQPVIFGDVELKPGFWCFSQKLVDCNLNTGVLLASANGGAVCRSRFPNLFGGDGAKEVVACQTSTLVAKGVLRDRLNNDAPVDPLSVVITSEDERVDADTYRFWCDYSKILDYKFIEHPDNRYAPSQDPCAPWQFPAVDTFYDAATDMCSCFGQKTYESCQLCKEPGGVRCVRADSAATEWQLPLCPDLNTLSTECMVLPQSRKQP